MMQATPKIFQKVKLESKKNHLSDVSDSFLYNVIRKKNCDLDFGSRFNCILKLDNEKDQKNKNDGMNKSAEETLINSQNKESPIKGEKHKKSNTSLISSPKFSGLEEDLSNKKKSKIIKKNVDIYEVFNKKGLIFHMKHPCSFSFFGEIKVTILSGEVEILGFTLNEFSKMKTVKVFSPNFFIPLVIESKPFYQKENKEKLRKSFLEYLKEDDVDKLLSKMSANDSVLLIEQIVSDFGQVINKYFEKQLFPKSFEEVSPKSQRVKILPSTFNFHTSENFKQFQKNIEWDKIPLGLCTVFCGGKGVGKSTLLKYYVNKFIAKDEKVLCLDFDPGQPEFAPPGCLSATVVDSPLLGPNFTHFLNPSFMVYFGEVDVSQNPTKYLESVKYIIESCQKNSELHKLRWFVNTMGFCKGLGVELMVTIIKLLKPMSVIQIQSSDFKRNFPFYLTAASVNSRQGFSQIISENESLFFDLRIVRSQAEIEGIALHGDLKSNKLREVALVSYFSQMISPPNYNFNAVQPYLIPFSKLYLGVDFLISPNDILKAFNCSVISLSFYEPGVEEILFPENEEYFKIIVKPDTTSCAALGFVRGIDCIQKRFYVITHLTIEELEKINCFTLGKISPPHPMILKQESVRGQTFYTSVSTVQVTKRVKRMFRIQPLKKNN